MTTIASESTSAAAFSERLFAAALGTMETLSVYVGDRLGWYASLHDDGPATSRELADRTATHERYAREWLEQQAVYGLLTVTSESGADERRYSLPAGAAEALLDQTSLAFLGALPRMLAASAVHLPELLESYRHGDGVSWEQLGDDARTSQADLNRPWFEQRLADALRSVPTLDARLRQNGVRIVDLGCGAGWSTIALARAYPGAEVVGVDIDAPSIELARTNAHAAGLGERVRHRLADGGSLHGDTFDVAFAFECVHDMPQPVAVLSAVERSLRPDGILVVMDEAVAEEFSAPGDDLERLMYGFSLFVCLPDGMSSAPSAGTGTVMRPATLQAYGQQAGFTRFEVLPIEDFGFWRFYALSR